MLNKGQNINSSTVKRYVGLVLGLTTSDTESIEVINAKRKVEKGNDYTTHLLPQLFKKDFTVKLTNKVLSETYNYETEINAIEFTKNKLIEIANSQTLFDIYIKLSDNIMYKRENLTFTSISFDKGDGDGNGYTCTFTIEPIINFKTKVFVSNKKYGNSKGTGSASSGGTSNRKQANKSSTGKPFNIGYYHDKRGISDYSNMADSQTWKKGYQAFQQYAKEHNFAIVEQYNEEPRYLLINNNYIKDVPVSYSAIKYVDGKYVATKTAPLISTDTGYTSALGGTLTPRWSQGVSVGMNDVVTAKKLKYKVVYRNGVAL